MARTRRCVCFPSLISGHRCINEAVLHSGVGGTESERSLYKEGLQIYTGTKLYTS
jgi:hypothetical protein